MPDATCPTQPVWPLQKSKGNRFGNLLAQRLLKHAAIPTTIVPAMQQPSLFPMLSQDLLDSERGKIVYESGFIDKSTAGRWFACLSRQVQWQAQRRQMYDREVDVPRLCAAFSEKHQWPTVLIEAMARVIDRVGAPFNSVGLNLYRDHNDSVALHNDTLDALQYGQPIALLSLGETRAMTIREKVGPHRRMHVNLEAGSLLVMSYDTQLHYDHGILKERTPGGPRISLAFRVHKPAAGQPREYLARGNPA